MEKIDMEKTAIAKITAKITKQLPNAVFFGRYLLCPIFDDKHWRLRNRASS